MDAVKLIDKLSKSPVVKNEMALEMQLGLPFIEKQNGRLFISFKPHKEVFSNGKMEYFLPDYEISFAYPFTHISYFKDLGIYKTEENKKPVCEVSEKTLFSKGRYLFGELYNECSRVLTMFEEKGNVSDLTLKKYKELFEETVVTLGIQKIYLK